MSSSKEEFGRMFLAVFRDSVLNVRDERINEAVENAYDEGIAITAAAL